MPHRNLVVRELSEFLGVLSHPHRIRLVEELRQAERDVNYLRDVLGISHSRVSQHLMVLRARHIVAERRQGRQVFYHLCQPKLAGWLLEATTFLEAESALANELREAIKKARRAWAHS